MLVSFDFLSVGKTVFKLCEILLWVNLLDYCRERSQSVSEITNVVQAILMSHLLTHPIRYHVFRIECTTELKFTGIPLVWHFHRVDCLRGAS